MSAAPTGSPTTGLTDKILNGVERAGNKLPEPFMLFLVLFAVTGVVSTAMAWAGVVVTVPGSEDPTVIKGLFTGEGLTWLTTTLGENFIGFPPLVTVLPILLAIGIAQHLVCSPPASGSSSAPRPLGCCPMWSGSWA